MSPFAPSVPLLWEWFPTDDETPSIDHAVEGIARVNLELGVLLLLSLLAGV